MSELSPAEKKLLERLIHQRSIFTTDMTTEECVALLTLEKSGYVDVISVKWDTSFSGNAFRDMSYVQLKLYSEMKPADAEKPEEPAKPGEPYIKCDMDADVKGEIDWDRLFLLIAIILFLFNMIASIAK